MNCPGCGHENRESAKFCEECGERLTEHDLDEGAARDKILGGNAQNLLKL